MERRRGRARARERGSAVAARVRDWRTLLVNAKESPLVSYTCFDVSLQDKIAHIVLKRPGAYNTMIPEFWNELPEIVRTIDDSGEARAIVISSTGKHFTAGMDLSVFTSDRDANERDAEMGRRRANFRRDVLRLQETF